MKEELFIFLDRRKVKPSVLESSYYSVTLDCCKKSIGIIGLGNPCWVSYWKTGGYWVQVWINNLSDKEIKKTTSKLDSDYIHSLSRRDQTENWQYFQLLFFLGGLGIFFPYCFTEIYISFWFKFKAHCYDRSREGQHSLYSRESDFTLVPDSQELFFISPF